MKRCSDWQLYAIIDRDAIGHRDMPATAAAAIRGGADVIQLRDKTASVRQLTEEAAKLLLVTQRYGVPLIVNDRLDVAQAVGADGVHVGQDDLPLEAARALLGEDAIIGRSTHSLEQAFAAVAGGADYIGLGPVFSTPTKPAYGPVGTALIRQVMPRVRIPVVCIGGIDAGNLPEVLEAGATCAAVIRAICSADDPESAARTLKQILAQSSRSTHSPSL